MANRRVEWQIALDSAGVSKGAKGIDAELTRLRQSFDRLASIRAFQKSQEDLRKFETGLAAAKTKAAALAQAAATGGSQQQAAYAKATAAVATLEQAVRRQTGELARQGAAIRAAGGSTRNLAQAEQQLSAAFRAATLDAKAAGQAQAAATTLGIKLNRNYRDEIIAMRKARADLAASGKASSADLARADAAIAENLKRIKTELQGLSPAAKAAAQAQDDLVNKLKQIGAAYLGIEGAKKALTISAAFGDEMAAVKAMTGATADEMERLRAKALSMAGAAGGPTAVAGAMASLGAAGYNVQQIMFSADAVNGMVASSRGLMSYGQAANNLAEILNLGGLAAEKSAFVADRLVLSANAATQSLPEAVEAIKQILGYFNELYKNKGPEVAFEKALAAASALSNLGTKGQKGGRVLKNALVQLVAPSAKAADIMSKLSEEEQEETKSALGVLAAHKDLIRIFDDQGNFRDFPDIIDDISKASLTAEEKMRIFGRIAGPAMFGWTNQGGQGIRDMEQKIHNADGTFEQVSDTMQAGLGGAFRMVKAEAEKATIILADPLDAALTKAIKNTRDYIYENKELATVVGVAGATFAGVAIGASSIATGFLLAGTAIGGIVAAAAGVALIPAIMTGTALAVGYAAKSYLEMHDAQDMAAESGKRAEESQKRYQDRLKRASAETGLTLTSYKDVQEAYKSGKIAYDALTDTYSKGSGVARKSADVQVKAAADVADAASGTAKGVADAVEVQEVKLKEIQKEWDEYAKKIKEIEQQIEEIGLSPSRAGDAGLSTAKKALEGLAATAQITGAAMTKSWDDPAKAVASYLPRVLGVADAEEAAVRKSLSALSVKDKALEAQHRQVLVNGKLLIEQQGVAAEVSKTEQEIIWDIADAYHGKLNAIMEVKSANGALIPGMQQVAGVWTNIGVAADRSNKQQIAGLSGLKLGLSSAADALFDLSLAGKSDLQVWNARKQAAQQYADAARALMAEGKQFAAAGDIDTATRKFEQAAVVAKKSEDAYKSLSTEVKNDFTPAMAAAHKSAEEGVKNYEKTAEKALSDAAKHYDKAKDAAGKLADRQLELEERLLKVRVAGQSSAEAYATMVSQAQKYEAAARSAMAAGNFDTAVAMADRAAGVWDSLGQEVKDGEQVIISAKQALTDQAAGIKSSGELAIQILAAQKAAEEAAGKAAEERAAKATAAKEAEAQKVADLEAAKEKVVISAEEGAQEAAAGTLAANQQIVEILEAQKTAIGEVADALNKQADWQLGKPFTDAGEAVKNLGDTVGKTVAEMTSALEAFERSGAASIAALDARLDTLVAKKRVIDVVVREVSAKASGGAIGTVTAMATGGMYARDARRGMHFPGFGGGDRWSNLVIAENGEYMQRKEATAALGGDGLALARAQNNLDFTRMQAILTKHLGPPQIKLDMPAPRQPQMQQLGIIKLQVGDVQAEVYATPDNAATIHAAIAEAQRKAQRTAQAKKRAGVK
jgi:TP901 family phage tail tape measure protein